MWICVAPAQKFASSSKVGGNWNALSNSDDTSDVTDLPARTLAKDSSSRSCQTFASSNNSHLGFFRQKWILL
ncbi:hypothetical protein Forpi1262_v015395 [Fusarium oxysporum f. sp. raphani]|uniref:Uncharacterized protein n=1 Tax=Fusarium oxysporum f. sp. raphani TaxID=96318 RepID=A0A8J5U252_FUSOX|nr:hypothetical protein Forpi1262_v015395 [Fusarium oxysporum f. sp. raphani]